MVSELYPGETRVRGEVLHAVQCETPIESTGRRVKAIRRVADQVAPGELEPLRALLRLDDWQGLDALVDRLLAEEAT